jgi:hypothetical protein
VLNIICMCSCESGITNATLGLLSKVAGGSIQVIQNVAAISTDVHPRNKLNGKSSQLVTESGQSYHLTHC